MPLDFVTRLLRKTRFVRSLEHTLQEKDAEIGQLRAENERRQAEIAEWSRFSPLGHFYSPVPSRADIEAAFARRGYGPPFAGIEFHEGKQLELLRTLAGYYPDQPFPESAQPGRRFHWANPSYGPFDACILYGMLRHLQPKRVVEVGCGYSSAALLDMNDRVFAGGLSLTFIDPDLSLFRRLLLPGDPAPFTAIEKCMQDVPDEVFASLESGDILFIDTSHVSKVGSDVNHLFFRVLPLLKPGVFIHIHDITGDLEYPRQWFEEGRAWNEIYLVRAFLMYNRAFTVVFSSAFMFNEHWEYLKETMPLCAGGGGGQLWLRKDLPD